MPLQKLQGRQTHTTNTSQDLNLVIQNGQLLTPKSSDGVQALLQAMHRGIQVAQDVLSSVCADIDIRVAPLAYEDMGSSGTLMQVSSPFVLMHIESHNIHTRMGYVFVPSALVKALLKHTGNSVVWTSHNGQQGYQPSAQEEAELLADLWLSVPHDAYITINTRINFALGDSDCALVSNSRGYYSVVSTMVHELLHAAGVYSLLEADRSGGLQGYASVFDALLKTTCTSCTGLDATAGCYVLDRQNLHHLTGSQLAGQTICVNESHVYNPSAFHSGSSLSHFKTQGSVMNSTIEHSTCRFELTDADIKALMELGWGQCNLTAAPHIWNTHDTLLPESLMRQITNLNTSGGSTDHTTTHTHTHCHRRHSSHEIDDCVDDDAHLWGFLIVTLVFLPACLCLGCYIFNPECKFWSPYHRVSAEEPAKPNQSGFAQAKWASTVHTPSISTSNEQVAQLFGPHTSAFVIE